MKGSIRGTPVRAWTTQALPESEQFAFWREVVWEAFTPVVLRRAGEGPFRGTVTAWRVGPLGVSLISSERQAVLRTPAEIARSAGDIVFLNLPLSEGSFAVQGGRTVRLGRGDFTLVDAARPFELGFTEPFRQISLMLPHDLVTPLLAAPGQATAVRVPGNGGVGAVASAAIQALARRGGALDGDAARALAGRLVDLVALAVGGVSAPPRSATRALLLRAAQDEVERSLADPGLAPSAVAQRVGVSVRYLHRLFADTGCSFGRWVLNRRLERCLRDLQDPSRRHWTIAQIALHHGFADPGYFSRAFKAQYGMTPREARSQSY
jgi:AraC family transcriptional regulator, positive regulator of tynA and feaB